MTPARPRGGAPRSRGPTTKWQKKLVEGDPPVHAVGERADRPHVDRPVIDVAARDDKLGDHVGRVQGGDQERRRTDRTSTVVPTTARHGRRGTSLLHSAQNVHFVVVTFVCSAHALRCKHPSAKTSAHTPVRVSQKVENPISIHCSNICACLQAG